MEFVIEPAFAEMGLPTAMPAVHFAGAPKQTMSQCSSKGSAFAVVS